jgi:hypothetical protein
MLVLALPPEFDPTIEPDWAQAAADAATSTIPSS